MNLRQNSYWQAKGVRRSKRMRVTSPLSSLSVFLFSFPCLSPSSLFPVCLSLPSVTLFSPLSLSSLCHSLPCLSLPSATLSPVSLALCHSLPCLSPASLFCLSLPCCSLPSVTLFPVSLFPLSLSPLSLSPLCHSLPCLSRPLSLSPASLSPPPLTHSSTPLLPFSILRLSPSTFLHVPILCLLSVALSSFTPTLSLVSCACQSSLSVPHLYITYTAVAI